MNCIEHLNVRSMKPLLQVIQYFYEIKLDRAILWCYLIWYVVTVYFYFDPSPRLWIDSLGISAVIGTALILSVSSGKSAKRDPWQVFRLYLMPFCVSSFSALIKGQGFIIIISPRLKETGIAIAGCAVFLLAVFLIKRFKRKFV
jgi:hypothetical protein